MTFALSMASVTVNLAEDRRDGKARRFTLNNSDRVNVEYTLDGIAWHQMNFTRVLVMHTFNIAGGHQPDYDWHRLTNDEKQNLIALASGNSVRCLS